MPLVAETAVVAACDHVGEALWLLHLEAPQVAAQAGPGQFILVRCSDPAVFDPLLPRAYFVHAVDSAAGRLSLLVEWRGRGSAWLCRRQAGDAVLVHGPAGRPVQPDRQTRNLLLLADGIVAAAGLALLASGAARRGIAVTLVENASADRSRLPAQLLAPDVELRLTTPEAGGLLGILPSVIRWADEIVVAAAPDLLETMASLRRARLEPFTLHAGLPVRAMPLLGAPGSGGGDALPCGAGWCGACVITTHAGPTLYCREGPAFPLEDLRFSLADGDDDAEL
jgi:dihydroorotate dehydrogenase electron transfer subunit